MSILTSPLPQTAAGAAVDTDFRCMLRFEALLFDEQMPAEAKVRSALKDFYPHGYHCTVDEAWAGLLWFYRCGAPAVQSSRSTAAEPAPARAYDFEQDAPLICAAFRQAYGIDLLAERMHWWQFRALFDGLPADCRICRVMEYRTADTDGMPDKTKEFYQRMKRRYALQAAGAAHRRQMTVEAHDAAFLARLRRS